MTNHPLFHIEMLDTPEQRDLIDRIIAGDKDDLAFLREMVANTVTVDFLRAARRNWTPPSS